MTSAPNKLLRRLEWQVIRRLDGRLQGAHRTVWHGVGIDFTDLRDYMPEDDVRHIDWNVTARMDEIFVRQYTEERELTAWLVLDRSASMRTKDFALNELAICLARLISHNGNRVGAVLFDNEFHKIIPPSTGRNQTLRIAHELERLRPKRSAQTTDLEAMLRLASNVARRRSLVFVLSDFIGESGWEQALARLGHRHEVVTIRLVDPVELDLPDLGFVVVEDAETGEQVVVDSSDPLLRQRLRAEVEGREAAVTEAMRRGGVVAHRVSTDEDIVGALVGMVRQSKRRRR